MGLSSVLTDLSRSVSFSDVSCDADWLGDSCFQGCGRGFLVWNCVSVRRNVGCRVGLGVTLVVTWGGA